MCDKTRQDRIRSDNIRKRVGITPIVEKILIVEKMVEIGLGRMGI